MSSWSCPHDLDGVCQRVQGALCDPGMRGCVLYGRFVFANQEKEVVRKPVPASKQPVRNAAAKAPRRRLPL